MTVRLACLAFLTSICLLIGCGPEPIADTYTHIDGNIFATRYRISYLGKPDVDTVKTAVEKELHRIDHMASSWKSDSELMRYNRSKNPDTFELSSELTDLLQRSREIEALTKGAFNIRFDGEHLDLSGIAKGYAVDQIGALLKDQFAIESFLVEIGGEIQVHGSGPNGEFWNVGIYSPDSSDSPVTKPLTLQLRDTSVATSGTYFKGDHLIDPRSGDIVNNALISVSVIHPSNTTADALATALFVMGPEEGQAWAGEHGIHVLFLFKDGRVVEVGG